MPPRRTGCFLSPVRVCALCLNRISADAFANFVLPIYRNGAYNVIQTIDEQISGIHCVLRQIFLLLFLLQLDIDFWLHNLLYVFVYLCIAYRTVYVTTGAATTAVVIIAKRLAKYHIIPSNIAIWKQFTFCNRISFLQCSCSIHIHFSTNDFSPGWKSWFLWTRHNYSIGVQLTAHWFLISRNCVQSTTTIECNWYSLIHSRCERIMEKLEAANCLLFIFVTSHSHCAHGESMVKYCTALYSIGISAFDAIKCSILPSVNIRLRYERVYSNRF